MALAKGTDNVTANLSLELSSQLAALAKRSGLSRSRYVGLLIEDAVRLQRTFTIHIEDSHRGISPVNYRLNASGRRRGWPGRTM